jgi:hypothetical protein
MKTWRTFSVCTSKCAAPINLNLATNVEYAEISDLSVVSTSGDLEIKAHSARYRPQNRRRRLRCLRHR